MIPSAIPKELQGLSQVEEMLIARAFPVIQVYTKPNRGQKAYKGHVLTLPNDVGHIAYILPRYPKDIPVIVFKIDGKDNKSRDLKVRRQKIIDALLWLTGIGPNGNPNSPLYKDIIIDQNDDGEGMEERLIELEDTDIEYNIKQKVVTLLIKHEVL